MTWNDLTVEQFQKLAPILEDTSLDNFDKETNAIALLTGMSEDDFAAMPYERYLELRKGYSFLHEGKIEGTAVNRITANGNRYKVNHDLRKMPIARYVEVKHFEGAGFVANLHSLMASIVSPAGGEFNHKDHGKYAEDMKKAKFVDVYHTCLFFCKLFDSLMLISPDSLTSKPPRRRRAVK